jgi:hypothetical protein
MNYLFVASPILGRRLLQNSNGAKGRRAKIGNQGGDVQPIAANQRQQARVQT